MHTVHTDLQENYVYVAQLLCETFLSHKNM